MPELDQMNPEMEPTQPEMGNQVMGLEPGQTDEEGAMAKADLYKLANYSFKLFKKLEDNAQLEGWVQAKITKAADYIASVYHYLEYEMEFSEYGHKLDNSDVLSEGQKRALKNKLMEAKAKIKELKVKQAEKAKDKVEEGAGRMIGGGKEESCTECGGTGVRLTTGMPVPDHVEKKIAKYKRLTKATHAAHKRLDRNGNGIPDALEKGDKPVDEEMSSTGGEITRPSKGVTRHSHNPKRFTDEPHTEPKSQAKSRSAADKAGDKAADKAAAKDSKDYEKKNPGTVTRVKDGKKVDPNAKKEKEVDEAQGGHSYGQGVYEGNKSSSKKKSIGPDQNDPYEKGWRAGFKQVSNPYDKGTPDYKKWAEGHADRMDQPDHYDEDITEGDVEDFLARGGKIQQGASTDKKTPRKKSSNSGDYTDFSMRRGEKGIRGRGYGYDPDDHQSRNDELDYPTKDIRKAEYEGYEGVTEGSGKKPDFLDMDKDGDKKEPMKKAVADKKAGPKKGVNPFAKKEKKTESYVTRAVAEAKKGKKPDFLDMDKDGDKKEPMKKAVADKKETVKESSELTRMIELTGRLNLNENVIVKESTEVDQIRALTKRILG